MADNRYDRNNQHINRHRPLALNLNNPNHPLNHGWEFSHHNEEFDQAVYTQKGMKLMFYNRNWLIEFPNGDGANYYSWPLRYVTEDALEELKQRS